jgi:acetyl-CoA acetyltransferase family protein
VHVTHVVDLARTPIGRFNGGLAHVRPDDLAAAVLAGLAERHPALHDGVVDDVWFGNANGAGEENRNVARMAVLLSGLPLDTPGATINRLCGSGLDAVIQGHRAIALGDADVVIAGGVESMTRAPWVLPKPDRRFPHVDQTAYSSSLGWRMVNPRMRQEWTTSMGEGAEILADRYGIERERQDELALRSHRRAQAAWESGRLAAELVAGPWELTRDESVRADSTLEALGRLGPAFRVEGSVTAGNSSPINDGAAAVVLASDAGLARLAAEPLARIVSTGVTALEPALFGLGPVEASRRALDRAGLSFPDVDVVELNEAFAAQALACLDEIKVLDEEQVNPNGGALALGHPLGATGARLVGTLARTLHARGRGVGLATACIGVGQGLAVVLQR